MSSGSRFTSIDVTNDNNIDVSFLFSHCDTILVKMVGF
jgi:hypothetical protein